MPQCARSLKPTHPDLMSQPRDKTNKQTNKKYSPLFLQGCEMKSGRGFKASVHAHTPEDQVTTTLYFMLESGGELSMLPASESPPEGLGTRLRLLTLCCLSCGTTIGIPLWR